MKNSIISLIIVLFSVSCLWSQSKVMVKADSTGFRKGYDIPAGIRHGTWDFDEWPGVDHPVVYKQNYMYNNFPNEKIKIDYFLSVFDQDDHEGYLKQPEDLRARGFSDILESMAKHAPSERRLLGIFAHPDDEVLLAGGLLADAAANGWDVKVFLVSNGADGSEGQKDAPSDILGAYNCFGVMKDGKVMVKTDVKAEKKLGIIKEYSRELGIRIEVLLIDLSINGKRIVQLGEMPGMDFIKTLGPGSEYRTILRNRLSNLVAQERPSIVLTHGKDGEYGNYLHKAIHDMMIDVSRDYSATNPIELYSCFPEYNFQDRITHFADLNRDNRSALIRKWNAVKKISFLFQAGNDYDKPWDPNDTLMDGVFVKDYGYDPETAEPPRYEFFQRISIGK